MRVAKAIPYKTSSGFSYFNKLNRNSRLFYNSLMICKVEVIIIGAKKKKSFNFIIVKILLEKHILI